MMKEASPKVGFKTTKRGYVVAHKYGAFEGANNDCGIIFTDRPFLLVVFTRAGNVLDDLCDMMADYSVYLDERDAAAAAEAAQRAAEEAAAEAERRAEQAKAEEARLAAG